MLTCNYLTLALCSNHPPIQWVPRAHSPALNGRGVKLTTRIHLVPRLRMHGTEPSLPHTSSWGGT